MEITIKKQETEIIIITEMRSSGLENGNNNSLKSKINNIEKGTNIRKKIKKPEKKTS